VPTADVEHAILLGCLRKYAASLNNRGGAIINSLHYSRTLIAEAGVYASVDTMFCRRPCVFHLFHGLDFMSKFRQLSSSERIIRRADKASMSGSDPNSVKIQAIATDGSRRFIDGTFGFFASRCLMLTVQERVEANCALSVEHNDILFLGEVASCKQDAVESFQISMRVKHTLTALESLTRLRDQLLGLHAGYSPAQIELRS
jgi:hypothetical protein